MKNVYQHFAFKKLNNSLKAATAAGMISLLYLAGCSDLPTDVVMPVFSTGADMPLIDTSTTINEIIRDTTFLKKDGTNHNLYISQQGEIPALSMASALQLTETSVKFTSALNDQAALMQEAVKTNTAQVTLNELFPSIPAAPGSATIPQVTNVEKIFMLIQPENVERVSFNKTQLRVGIKNDFPLDLTVGTPQGYSSPGVVIEYPDGTEQFIALNEAQRSIPKFSERGFDNAAGGLIAATLSNKEFKQGVGVRANILTQGSGGQPVNYDRNSVLTLNVSFADNIVKEAKFSYAANQLTYSINAPFNGNTKLTEAEVNNFEMSLKIENQFSVSGNAVITMPQFRRISDGAPLMKQVRIEKKSTQSVTVTNNLEAYRLVKDAADSKDYMDAARVTVDFALDPTSPNDKQLFKETEQLKIDGTIATLRFNKVKGLSLPENIFAINSETKFDVKGNISNLTFDELSLQDMGIDLVINNGTGIKGTLSGTADIFGKNGNKLTTVALDNREILAPEISSNGNLLKENIIRMNQGQLKLKEIPYSVRFNGSMRTTDNTPFSIDAQDKIDGKVVTTIPLTLSIKGGTYKRDLTRLDLSESIRRREKNIRVAELKIESRNRMPANIGLTIRFFDENSVEVLKMPNDAEAITILGAPVNSTTGIATEEAKSFQRVKLSQEQTKILMGAKFYTVESQFSTNGDHFSKFMLEDYLKMKIGLDFKGNSAE